MGHALSRALNYLIVHCNASRPAIRLKPFALYSCTSARTCQSRMGRLTSQDTTIAPGMQQVPLRLFGCVALTLS